MHFAQTRAALHSAKGRCALGPDGPEIGGNCSLVQIPQLVRRDALDVTILGSKLASRSRGTSISTRPVIESCTPRFTVLILA
ncbi:hypothetical protein [Streptomyces capitiformicae]|uniref:Uncharacterized protein n=1 Tax=Streptomyces capitiformicae TaxID=2014920 RepID=A0A918ZVK4_9ACTN|nr:hypothetical protein GCM10017771_93790 [Streptomyces capitiformicae]